MEFKPLPSSQSIAKSILKKMKNGHGLIDVICEIVEASDDIDFYDVADAIGDNPTMIKTLEAEFKSRNMMTKEKDEINLTEIFKEL